MIFKVKLNLKVKIYPIFGLWDCPGDKSIPNKVRFSEFRPKIHLSTVKGPYWFWDWLILIFSFVFNFKPVIFYQILRLLNICVVLYIFSETIASECSTSHMAPHIYWFLCIRAGSRHGPWSSLPLYLGETIGVQPASPRQLALDFTSCYWFSPCHIRFACRNFICQTLINHRNNSKKVPIGLYFVPQACSSAIFSVVNWYIPTSLRDSRLFHILTSFVLSMLIASAVSWAVNRGPSYKLWTRLEENRQVPILSYHIHSAALFLQTWSPEYRAENTLQSDNPTSYFINAYIFMAITTFIRWFLASICVVIWIYFVYFSPWRVRIWREDLVNKWTWFLGDRKVAGFMSLSVLLYQHSGAIY